MSSETDDEFNIPEARKLVISMNRKKKKAGGFQAMGLSTQVFNGVLKKGYKVPTPIQRKTVPLILAGRDVVAMARTGSGKTAAFLIPLFEKLKCHLATGPRALIKSPTRELAVQTLKFTKDLGRYTGLTAAVILGGDKMEDQFQALHSNPDIIIATPGRLMHLIIEMDLKLRSIEYVVFDEGDRLFELGFAAQLTETLARLPRSRQTLIFSATLPNNLIEFARAGLINPVLIRLDVDTKLSKNLKLVHISCLPDQKNKVLLYLIRSIIPNDQQIVIFFATKHHVEFYKALFCELGLNCTSVHSGLDPIARSQAMKQFSQGQTRILLVTDVAARGVDLPHLDNVINYHFPTQPKLFLHRVGRVARAGRSGIAYSLIDTDDLPYLFDVFVFLGKSINTSPKADSEDANNECLARPPHGLTEGIGNPVDRLIKENTNLASLNKVCTNAMKRFIKTRPKASSESVRRAKSLRSMQQSLPVHPIFPEKEDENSTNILEVIRGLKLPTIFEALGRQANPAAYDMMAKKRRLHNHIIARHNTQMERAKKDESFKASLLTRTTELQTDGCVSTLDPEPDLRQVELFVPYVRGNEASERGMAVSAPDSSTNHFGMAAQAAALNLIGDDGAQNESNLRPAGSRLRKQVWDRRRKRYVSTEAMEGTANLKRIKTESGTWIPASYKTDKYDQWLKRSKADQVMPANNRTEQLLHMDAATVSKTTRLTRYGAVVEFPDEATTDQRYRKGRKLRPPTMDGDNDALADVKALSKSRNKDQSQSEPQLTVLGTQPWNQRANIRQRERAQRTAEAAHIRQPKGTRTFGQLRRPEQVLKLQRQREQRLQAAQKKKKQMHQGPSTKGKHVPMGKRRK